MLPSRLGCAAGTTCPMRSPWVGSLALLAPARSFLAHSSVAASGDNSMLQAFVRPATTAGVRAIAGGAWRQYVRQRCRPSICSVSTLRMKSGGESGAKNGNANPGGANPKEKARKKVDSYYKQTVILPQTEFQQVWIELRVTIKSLRR